MPKEIREISNFHTGTILNASEKDIPDDSAAFSLNISPTAENGILDAINNNKLILANSNSHSKFLYPISWNANAFAGSSASSWNGAVYNNSDYILEDISILNNDNISKIKVMGIKGHVESLRVYDVEPWWEKVVIEGTTTSLEFKTLEAFSATSDYIKYLTPAASTATLTVADGDDSTSGAMSEKESVVIVSTDGTIKRYVIVDDNATTVATGAILASGSDIGSGDLSGAADAYLIGGIAVAINTSGTESTQNAFLVQLKAAIEHADGHNGKITVSAVPGEATGNQSITLTQATIGRTGDTTTATNIGILTAGNFSGGSTNSVAASATITIGSSSDGEFTAGEYVDLITTNGGTHRFIAGLDFAVSGTQNNNNAANLASAINSTNQFVAVTDANDTDGNAIVYIKQIFHGTSGNTTVTENFAKASKTDFSGGVGVDDLSKYVEEGDYLAIAEADGSPAFSGRGAGAFETIQVTSVDDVAFRIYVKRKCFGTFSTTLSSATSYFIYSNRFTVNSRQYRTTRGTVSLDGWSDYAGNNIGGTANWFVNVPSNVHNYGVITASSTNVVFDADDKTMDTNTTNLYRVNEGDKVTVWSSVASAINSGSTFSITKKVADVFTLDTAPTGGTLSSGTVYLEPGLIKNPYFIHSVVTADETDVAANKTYKVNKWAHRAYRHEHNAGEFSSLVSNSYFNINDTGDNAYSSETNNELHVARVSSGGYWDETTTGHADKSAYFYPFNASDAYIKLISHYSVILQDLEAATTASDTLLVFNTSISGTISKRDILLIDTEYIKVLKVKDNTIEVERGFFNSIPAAHTKDSRAWKCVNTGIHQDIPKDDLKKGQGYRLSFFAKALDDAANKAVGKVTLHASSDTVAGEAIILTSTDGTEVTYRVASSDTAAIREFSYDATSYAGAAGLESCIDNANGHNGKIAVSRSNNILTLTQATAGEAGNTEITSSLSNATIESFSGADARGFVSLRLNGGYFNSNGIWQESSDDDEAGHVSSASEPTQEVRWVNFNELDKPDIDSANADSSLDTVWRRFTFDFYLPKGQELLTDLELDFCTRGRDNTVIGLDIIDLSEINIVTTINDANTAYHNTGVIDNSGIKQLILYDKNNEKLEVATNFISIYDAIQESTTNAYSKSPFAATDFISSNKSATFVSKNRETHIGFGGEEGDTAPQWLGYVNSMIFDRDVSKSLYLDEDTIHTYDDSGVSSMSKICVAGEHECLTSSGTTTLVITHANHNMNVGDNIVVREWEDVDNSWDGAGVWVVTAISAGVNFTCKRLTSVDANPSGAPSNNKVCYRPYFYYGIKDGDYSIYRIWPDTRISDGSGTPALDTSGDYKRGRVERSMPLNFTLTSITTCYNKASDGTGGGCIYALSYIDDTVVTINVEKGFDKWKASSLSVLATLSFDYKSFKWSNDNINGNIGGDTAVWDSLADESSPSISPAGIPSDIIETKSPIETYDPDVTANTTNTSAMFDTRLWIQYRPPGGTGFTAGQRFLFAGITTSSNTTSSGTIPMADRTPSTCSLEGDNKNYDRSDSSKWRFNSGPGARTGNSPLNKGDSYFYHWDSTWSNSPDFMQRFKVLNPENGYAGGTRYEANGGTYNLFPYTNWGENVGWYCRTAEGLWESVSIKVAKYGLVRMADNDHDGIIDGTGLVVPSNVSITDTSLSGKTSVKTGPYGELHHRVCGHAVGLLGSSDKPWIKHWGRMVNSIFSQYWKSGRCGDNEGYWLKNDDAPEHMSATKVLFISSDVHFGDYGFAQSYNITANATIDSGKQTQFTLTPTEKESEHLLQPGDLVTIAGVGANTGGVDSSGTSTYNNISTYVAKVDSTTQITVPLPYVDIGTVTHTLTPWNRKNQYYFPNNPGALADNIFAIPYYHGTNSGTDDRMHHRSFSHVDKSDGTVFTDVKDENQGSPGNFARHWLTVPTSWGMTAQDPGAYTNDEGVGGGSNTSPSDSYFLPGMCFPIEKLNYRAGCLMRPFEMSDNAFEDLVVGNGINIDIASAPDVVYHKNNGSNLHYHVNDANVNNQFASKLVISCDMEDEDNLGKSKIYICDLNFQYPDIGNQTPVVSEYDDSDTNDYNLSASYDVKVAGTLGSSPYITSSTAQNPNANVCPVVKIANKAALTFNDDVLGAGSQYRYRNVFTGMCLTVVDATTGTMQTRYVLGSRSEYTTTANNYHDNNQPTDTTDAHPIYLDIHYPFGHAPVSGDTFFLWRHGQACTSSIRLFREKELGHELGSALKADPILSNSIFKPTGTISDLDSDTTTATATTSTPHHLTTNDVVAISDASDTDYHGVYTITVTDPKKFTFTTTGSNLTDDSTATWTLTNATTSSNTIANPLMLNLDRAIFNVRFGGLDMRKLRAYATEGTDITNDSGTRGFTDIDGDHLLSTGDTVTMRRTDGTVDTWEGIYPITEKDADEFYITNTTGGNDTDPWTVTTNQWEIFSSSATGQAFISEQRFGFNSWDKGNSQGNLIRSDVATATTAQKYVSQDEEEANNVTIKAGTAVGSSDDFFKSNTNYEYKISLIYDGYQEGPLSASSWIFSDDDIRAELEIKIKISNYSNRLSHICLYRRDNANDFYKLVKEIRTDGGWSNDSGIYSKSTIDNGEVGATYEARTGISEVIDSIKIKYGISAEIDGYLFVGDCGHENIRNAKNMIFRSKAGMFSIFNYVYDFLVLKSQPTALVNFAGRLFAFDKTNTYKINPESLVIEDIFEGIGCLGKDSVIVTDYGMFFADKNGAYMHNGTTPTRISDAITAGGGINTTFGGTDNIKDVSWNAIMKYKDASPPYVSFDSDLSCVLFFVNCYAKKGTVGTTSSSSILKTIKKQYIWSFHTSNQRWDLWELDEDSELGVPFIGEEGKVLIPLNNTIYELRGGSTKKDYTWISKKLSMDSDSVGKVFNKVKINGIESSLNLNGSYNESSDRLLISTNTGLIDTSDVTYSTKDTNHSSYKLSGSNRKGRWVQTKLENMTSPIDSIGIIFRRKGVK